MFILDTIDTELYRHEQTKLKKKYLTATYQLGKTIRNKILNDEEAVNYIYGNEDVSFCLDADQCDCADFSFCDCHHKHIVTVNSQIIKNNNLRKLLAKGPNYREPSTINFSLIEITTVLDKYLEVMILKTKYNTSIFKLWKEKVLVKVKEQITR